MLRKELVHSCSYPAIADAALRSLGCDLRKRVAEAADANERDPGVYAAGLVREFSDIATDREWRSVAAVMSGDDTPVLTGFRYILEYMMGSDDGLDDLDKLIAECSARSTLVDAYEAA